MHFKTDRKKESKGIMQWVYYLSSSSTATARVSVYHTHYYSTVIIVIIIIIIIIALSCELDVISFYI
jgi:hypothetical protein